MARPPEGGPLGSGEKEKGQLRLLRAGQPHLGRDPPAPAQTHPPLLVLLAVHDDHVPLRERQLVRVVGHAVVQGFDPLGLQLGLRQEGAQSSVCGETHLLRGEPGRFASNGSPGPASLQACAPSGVSLGRLSAAWGRGTSWRRPTWGRQWQSGAWCADRGLVLEPARQP